MDMRHFPQKYALTLLAAQAANLEKKGNGDIIIETLTGGQSTGCFYVMSWILSEYSQFEKGNDPHC